MFPAYAITWYFSLKWGLLQWFLSVFFLLCICCETETCLHHGLFQHYITRELYPNAVVLAGVLIVRHQYWTPPDSKLRLPLHYPLKFFVNISFSPLTCFPCFPSVVRTLGPHQWRRKNSRNALTPKTSMSYQSHINRNRKIREFRPHHIKDRQRARTITQQCWTRN